MKSFHLLAGATLLVLTSGCGTTMFTARLDQRVALQRGDGIEIAVGDVAVSAQLMREEFYAGSRLALALSMSNRGSESRTLDLRSLELTLRDAAGRSETRAPLATGLGTPPASLHDGEFTSSLVLAPGETRAAWVAFGGFAQRAVHEIPERIALRARGSTPVDDGELLISDPGKGPIWHARAWPRAFSVDFMGIFSPGGRPHVAFVNTNRYALEPVWFTWGWGPLLSEPSPNQQCCGLTWRSEVGLPLEIGRVATVSAYFGGAVMLTPRESVGDGFDAFGGPELGLDIAVAPLPPRHGPFPISYARSILSSLHLKAGFAWWFGSGLNGSDQPGLVVGMSSVFGN